MCDGDWEHSGGVRIENLDNPGWLLTCDLERSWFEGEPGLILEDVKRSETDWLIGIITDDRKLQISCGPRNLDEAISKFLDFVNSHGQMNPYL
jgi:hypothetical protein